jgi:hypothetical protein
MRAHQIEETSAIYDRVEQGRIERMPEVSLYKPQNALYSNLL